MSDIVSSVADLLTTGMNKIWPNPEDKAKGEAIAGTAVADAAIRTLQAEQAVMLAEASSADPWTSRARPFFLYVMYFLLLMSVPMGILSAFHPNVATGIISGFRAWLMAIPENIIDLFGLGYLGYSTARSLDKFSSTQKKSK